MDGMSVSTSGTGSGHEVSAMKCRTDELIQTRSSNWLTVESSGFAAAGLEEISSGFAGPSTTEEGTGSWGK
jgi:hypothetical protein